MATKTKTDNPFEAVGAKIDTEKPVMAATGDAPAVPMGSTYAAVAGGLLSGGVSIITILKISREIFALIQEHGEEIGVIIDKVKKIIAELGE